MEEFKKKQAILTEYERNLKKYNLYERNRKKLEKLKEDRKLLELYDQVIKYEKYLKGKELLPDLYELKTEYENWDENIARIESENKRILKEREEYEKKKEEYEKYLSYLEQKTFYEISDRNDSLEDIYELEMEKYENFVINSKKYKKYVKELGEIENLKNQISVELSIEEVWS